MQNRLPPFYLLLLIFLLPIKSYSQEKYDVSIGATIPEGYNIGFKYNYKTDRRLDFYFGHKIPFEYYSKWNTFTVNHAFYFGKIKSKANGKLWTVNTGFLYGIYSDNQIGTHNGYVNLYFAREIIISPKIYLEPKLGGSYMLFYNVSRGTLNGYIIRIAPNFGLNLGFKI